MMSSLIKHFVLLLQMAVVIALLSTPLALTLLVFVFDQSVNPLPLLAMAGVFILATSAPPQTVPDR